MRAGYVKQNTIKKEFEVWVGGIAPVEVGLFHEACAEPGT